MAFSGTTSSEARNRAQEALFAAIGNASTRPRSVELACRAELALFKRSGERDDATYEKRFNKLVKLLKDAKDGFELNRKLLSGETTPEKWVEKKFKQRPQLVSRAELEAKNEEAKKAPATRPAGAARPASKKPPAQEKDEEREKGEGKKETAAGGDDAAGAKKAAAAATTGTPQPATAAAAAATGAGAPKKKDGDAVAATDASSYYFFKSTPKEKAAEFAPKKIDPAAAAAAAAATAKPTGASSWNSGGTWEERDISDHCRKYFVKLLCNIDVPEFDGGEAKLDDGAWIVSGSSSSVFVRGKVKVGYELTVKGKWKGTHNGVQCSGTLRLEEVDEVDGPSGAAEMIVKCDKEDAAHSAVRSAVRKTSKEIARRFAQLLADLKEH